MKVIKEDNKINLKPLTGSITVGDIDKVIKDNKDILERLVYE